MLILASYLVFADSGPSPYEVPLITEIISSGNNRETTTLETGEHNISRTYGYPYTIEDSGQTKFYDSSVQITAPKPGDPYYGEDAQFSRNPPVYRVSNDGLTVYDNNTGLTWQRSPDTNGDGSLTSADKLTWTNVQGYPTKLNVMNFGGYNDWRIPTIKELYSLINFKGTDPSPTSASTSGLTPFIDANNFKFAYGQTDKGERIIDSQYASRTLDVSNGSNGQKLFGVNFADGRIKGYGLTMPGPSGQSLAGSSGLPGMGGTNPRGNSITRQAAGQFPGGPGGLPPMGNGGMSGQTGTSLLGAKPKSADKTFFLICVRGNTDYGENIFVNNGDGTITDRATGLTWSRDDSSTGMNWKDALTWVQTKNSLNYLGYSDWRLPNAKELESIVDYTRSPDTTGSAAIDPVFNSTRITNEAGQPDFPYYWTGTTHGSADGSGTAGVYIAFGRAMGYMDGKWQDVHGAGAQRSDPKAGNPADYPQGRGPQGDAIRIYNYVRLVRDASGISIPLLSPSYSPSQTRTISPRPSVTHSQGLKKQINNGV